MHELLQYVHTVHIRAYVWDMEMGVRCGKKQNKTKQNKTKQNGKEKGIIVKNTFVSVLYAAAAAAVL